MALHIEVPIAHLTLSKANARKMKPSEAEFHELVASIHAHGLKQNLVVVAQGDGYEVVAGGRRLKALQYLVDHGELEANTLIPCRVESPEDAFEASVTENLSRSSMHPADEIDAFHRLHRDGASVEEIATRFGRTPKLVESRLRLAAVHGTVRQAYRAGKMTLKTLEAFTLTLDKKAHLEMWNRWKTEDPQWAERQIRRAFTFEVMVPADHWQVTYCGLKAYRAAGGTVTEDLFAALEGQPAGWIDDPALLERLCLEKLERHADRRVRKQGWKWVHCVVSPDDNLIYGLDRLKRKKKWTEAQKAVSGVLLHVGTDGRIETTEGLVRKEDRAAARKVSRTRPGFRAQKSKAAKSREEAGYSKALERDMQALRTCVVKTSLASEPDAAFDLILWELMCQVFGDGITGESLALRASAISSDLPGEDIAARTQFEQLQDEMLELHETWIASTKQIGGSALDGFRVFRALEDNQKRALLAFCAASLVRNCLSIGSNRSQVLEAVLEDLQPPMHLVRPSAAVFWDRLSKKVILKHMAAAGGSAWADEHKGRKKADLAVYAAEAFREPRAADMALTEEQMQGIEAWVLPGFRPAAEPEESAP